MLNVPVYAEGYLYPPTAPATQPVATTIAQLQKSGFTTPILGLFHIGRDYDISPPQIMGDLYFNDSLVISKGEYVGDSSWPDLVNQMVGGSVVQVCASIGGGTPVQDFGTIQRIFEQNGNSFAGTNLMASFQALRKTFPGISIIDMDCEDNYDQPSFVAFCQMLIGIGFGITFCPYMNKAFWTDCLQALNQSNPKAIKWWNLQCYDGGAGNQPSNWAAGISLAIPGFSIQNFIVPGDWTNDLPGSVEKLMAGFSADPSVGGGFIWTLDEIIQKNPQDPMAEMAAYVNAISSGLGPAEKEGPGDKPRRRLKA